MNIYVRVYWKREILIEWSSTSSSISFSNSYVKHMRPNSRHFIWVVEILCPNQSRRCRVIATWVGAPQVSRGSSRVNGIIRIGDKQARRLLDILHSCCVTDSMFQDLCDRRGRLFSEDTQSIITCYLT